MQPQAFGLKDLLPTNSSNQDMIQCTYQRSFTDNTLSSSVSALLISVKLCGLKITRGCKIHGACIYSLAMALTLHHV